MKIVKVSSGRADLSNLLLRQSPAGQGIWGDCRFIVNQPVEKCDWWVVCHQSGLQSTEVTWCDPKHLVFISMEPGEGGVLERFYAQFAKLVLCDRRIEHPDITYFNGHTWWVGMNVKHENGHHFYPHVRYGYDCFKEMDCPGKKLRISVICSQKSTMPGHRKRLEFLEKLSKHPIGNHVDIFGGGVGPIADKWDVIAPYKYHIVLENSVVPDYWSEKLADGFLGFALPIYHGCPNIHDYFSPQSLRLIDINDFDRSVALLENILEHDPYEEHAGAIIHARNQVLDEYNIFQLMADICNKPGERFVKCRLKPPALAARTRLRRLARKVIHRLRGVQAD